MSHPAISIADVFESLTDFRWSSPITASRLVVTVRVRVRFGRQPVADGPQSRSSRIDFGERMFAQALISVVPQP